MVINGQIIWGGVNGGPHFVEKTLKNVEIFDYNPMGPCPELTPGGGAMPGINPWGYMRGNTVYWIFDVCISERKHII